jgi:thiosulfate reductase cytochrome b subunit
VLAHEARAGNPRYTVTVRITHWITAAAFLALLVSGVAILLAHPRLYWGEAGALGSPSLVDLPLPFVLTGQTGWGRSLHFLAAWILVIAGSVYMVSGIRTLHFRTQLLPTTAELSWTALAQAAATHLRFDVSRPASPGPVYNVLQKLAYSWVVFALFPLMIWTGLAMSPAITSAFPILVVLLSGQQSARTIHFAGAGLLLAFLIVHVTMVSLTGFLVRMRGITIGR